MSTNITYLPPPGDLREESQDGAVSKEFVVQPANTGTVTWEQLVAMFFPLNEF